VKMLEHPRDGLGRDRRADHRSSISLERRVHAKRFTRTFSSGLLEERRIVAATSASSR
jgi:hypothetical protein